MEPSQYQNLPLSQTNGPNFVAMLNLPECITAGASHHIAASEIDLLALDNRHASVTLQLLMGSTADVR